VARAALAGALAIIPPPTTFQNSEAVVVRAAGSRKYCPSRRQNTITFQTMNTSRRNTGQQLPLASMVSSGHQFLHGTVSMNTCVGVWWWVDHQITFYSHHQCCGRQQYARQCRPTMNARSARGGVYVR